MVAALKPALVFIGFMAAGKSTAAREAAAALGVAVHDTDALLEAHFGAPLQAVFDLEGGMTTGEPLVLRAAMKPLPTLTKPLRSVDIATREPAQALRERTDSAVVPAAGVVGEAMVAFVLASAYRAKFGGDHIDDVREALGRYEERIGWLRR